MTRRSTSTSVAQRQISVPTATTILLADDHASFRASLRELLEEDPDLEVVGEAQDGAVVVTLARRLAPDVVLMDVAMPVQTGVEATRAIVGESRAVAVVALSMHANKLYVDAMLAAGARGYLVKGGSAESIRAAVRAVAAGETLPRPDAS